MAGKSTACSFGKQGFDFYHSHGRSQLSISLALGDLTSSSVLREYRTWVCCTDINAGITHKIYFYKK